MLAIPVIFAGSAGWALFHPNIDRAYPQRGATAASTLRLSFTPDAIERSDRVYVSSVTYGSRSAMDLQIDFDESGVADGYAVQVDDVRASIDGPDGFHWDSPWQRVASERFLPGTKHSNVHVVMSPAVFNRIEGSKVRLHLTLAISRLRAGTTTNLKIPTGDFAIPGFGVCVAPQDGVSPEIDTSNIAPTVSYEFPMLQLNCRSALRQPSLTYIRAQAHDGPRVKYQTDSSSTMPVDTWQGKLVQAPADLGISPIVIFTPWNASVNRAQVSTGGGSLIQHPLSLVPGTPIAFTPYRLVDSTRADFTFNDVTIPKW